MEVAKANYDAGRFDESLRILKSILEDHGGTVLPSDPLWINRGERWEVYRLLTLNYFYMKQMEEAEYHLRQMILLDPDYRPKEGYESSDFIHFYTQHKVYPFGLGIRAGASLGIVDTLVSHSVNGNPTDFESSRKYPPAPGFGVNLLLDIYLGWRVWFTVEPAMAARRVTYQDRSFALSLTDYKETLYYAELPVSFKWEFLRFGNSPYIRLGITPGYLFGSRAIISNSSEENIFEGSLLVQRNRWSFSPIGAIGANLEAGSGKISIETRFLAGMRNVVRRDTRWDNEFLIFNYFHLDDDFLLHSVELSVAYTYIFQTIRKKI
jgi:hypothetical protein